MLKIGINQLSSPNYICDAGSKNNPVKTIMKNLLFWHLAKSWLNKIYDNLWHIPIMGMNGYMKKDTIFFTSCQHKAGTKAKHGELTLTILTNLKVLRVANGGTACICKILWYSLCGIIRWITYTNIYWHADAKLPKHIRLTVGQLKCA